MISLPIVARELRVASRRRGTTWLRVVMAAFGVLACLQWFGGGLVAVNPAAAGRGAFQMLSVLGLVLVLGAPIFTADCISHERREGTLGLLFLTTLKSHDVVLGKFTVTGLVALYALLGFAPVLMLPLTMGGVTSGEVVRMILVLLNTLFLSLATGMFVSVRARSQFGAVLTAFGVLSVMAFGPFLVEALTYVHWLLPFSMFSPIYGFRASDDALYAAFRAGFWSSLIIAHIIGWLLVLMATFRLRHNWRQAFASRALKVSVPKARRLLAPPRVILFDRENRRRAFAPVARAVLRMSGQRGMAWLAAFISFLGSIWNVAMMNQLGSVWAATSVSQVFTLASSALFAFIAGRFFFESRRSGELELLLVTPIGARGILREQRLALLRLLLGPLYLVLAGSIIATAGILHFNGENTLTGLFLGLCNMLGSVLGVLAVCRVSMWFGTRVNSPFALVGVTVGLVMVAPIAVVFATPILLFGKAGNPMLWSAVAAPLLVGKNILFLWWADRKLKGEFRTRERSLLKRWSGWFTAASSP